MKNDPQFWLVVIGIVGLLFTIIALIFRVNNNLVRGQQTLKTIVETVDDHDLKLAKHGNKISELIGAANTRVRIGERIEPLSY